MNTKKCGEREVEMPSIVVIGNVVGAGQFARRGKVKDGQKHYGSTSAIILGDG